MCNRYEIIGIRNDNSLFSYDFSITHNYKSLSSHNCQTFIIKEIYHWNFRFIALTYSGNVIIWGWDKIARIYLTNIIKIYHNKFDYILAISRDDEPIIYNLSNL